MTDGAIRHDTTVALPTPDLGGLLEALAEATRRGAPPGAEFTVLDHSRPSPGPLATALYVSWWADPVVPGSAARVGARLVSALRWVRRG